MQAPGKLTPIEFNWDSGNKTKNVCKHKVENIECEEIFLTASLLLIGNKVHSQNEPRFAALGTTSKGRKLFVAFTIRQNSIRVISARVMDRKERRFYDKTQANTKV